MVKQKLDQEMSSAKEFIFYFSPGNVELETIFKYIKFLITLIPKQVSVDDVKSWMLEKIDEFILTKFKNSEELIVQQVI